MAKCFRASSKQGMQLLKRARVDEGFSLESVYGRYSETKRQEWTKCLAKCESMGGRNFHICSHNTWQFSVAWETDDAYYIETANNSYVVYKNW